MPHRPVSLPARRIRVSRQVDPDAGRGRVLQRDQATAPNHGATIIRWKQRFRQYGLDGLDTYHPGQKPRVLTPALRARILSATRRKPSDGSTHWSCRKLALHWASAKTSSIASGKKLA